MAWLLELKWPRNEQECNALDQCFTCWPGAKNCNPIADYQRLMVTEHGRLSGEADMKVRPEHWAFRPASSKLMCPSAMGYHPAARFARTAAVCRPGIPDMCLGLC